MFIFKKLITPFILPPGLFIALLGVLTLWCLRRRNRSAALICAGVGTLIWLAASGPVAVFLMRSLESGLTIPRNPQGDVIIVLGGGSYDKAPDLSGVGTPGPATMERMVTAARLQRRLGVPIIISGGATSPTDTPVALLTERFLIDLGIPPQRILPEIRSRDTYENAIYSKAICDQYGFTRPLVVTSGFHIKRAVFCFEKAGLAVTPYPCALTTWKDMVFDWRQHLLPNIGNLSATAAALHEWIGLIYYRIVY